jgi:hypothetical protein
MPPPSASASGHWSPKSDGGGIGPTLVTKRYFLMSRLASFLGAPAISWAGTFFSASLHTQGEGKVAETDIVFEPSGGCFMGSESEPRNMPTCLRLVGAGERQDAADALRWLASQLDDA